MQLRQCEVVQDEDKHIINKKNLPKWQQKLYDGNGRHTYIMYETTNKSGKQQHKLLATSHYYDPLSAVRWKLQSYCPTVKDCKRKS